MKMQTICAIALSCLVSACAANGQVSNDVLQKISICSAGHRQSVSADIEAKIAQDIRTGGHVSGTLSSEIKGAFLSDSTVPAADRLAAYQAYIDCVEHIQI